MQEDAPPINVIKIKNALKQKKNGKAAGNDEISTEMLKEDGNALLNELENLFNRCLKENGTPTGQTVQPIIAYYI